MSLQGNLETLHIASILQLLSQERKTGILRVSSGQNNVQIFIKNGIIFYAMSSEKEFRLGHLLKAKGILSDEQLRECLQSAEEKKQQLGKFLVENGHISIDTLKNVLHYQAKEILYNLFLWETGDFEYKDVPLSVEGKLFVPLNTIEIVLEASRRIDDEMKRDTSRM